MYHYIVHNFTYDMGCHFLLNGPGGPTAGPFPPVYTGRLHGSMHILVRSGLPLQLCLR
jgi:hypothetical protein